MNVAITKQTLLYARAGSPPFVVEVREEPNGEFRIECVEATIGEVLQVSRATLRNLQALLAEVVIL